jgi:hypothetical protein
MAVPEKYNYLANNASRRDQSKSRKPKAAAVLEARRKATMQRKSVAKTLGSGGGQDMNVDDMNIEMRQTSDGGANESDDE